MRFKVLALVFAAAALSGCGASGFKSQKVDPKDQAVVASNVDPKNAADSHVHQTTAGEIEKEGAASTDSEAEEGPQIPQPKTALSVPSCLSGFQGEHFFKSLPYKDRDSKMLVLTDRITVEIKCPYTNQDWHQYIFIFGKQPTAITRRFEDTKLVDERPYSLCNQNLASCRADALDPIGITQKISASIAKEQPFLKNTVQAGVPRELSKYTAKDVEFLNCIHNVLWDFEKSVHGEVPAKK